MTSKPRLLIVEDEKAIRIGLIDVFIYHGFDVDSASDGEQGLQQALHGCYDLILLDVMLPGRNGFEICDILRQRDRHLPIIMLTAKGTDEDIIQGLSLGADDYVTKPFSIAQLVLRVQAVLRRTLGDQTGKGFRLGDQWTIDCLNLCARQAEQEVAFTRREMDILAYLHAHNDRPVPREELLHKVWGYARDLDLETRTVDIHIAKLRRKLETDPKQPSWLITVRGGGYRLLSAPL